MQNYVRSIALSGIVTSKLTVTTTWPGTTLSGAACSTANAKGCMVKVKVAYSYNLLPQRTTLGALTLNATVQQDIQQ